MFVSKTRAYVGGTLSFILWNRVNVKNKSMHFQKCKHLFEYQHLLLETSGDKSYDLYLNVVCFFNTIVI
jgi:hypothetical protein